VNRSSGDVKWLGQAQKTALDVWMAQHPGEDISGFYKIQPAVQSTQIRVDNPKPPAPGAGDARSDRSVQFNTKRLDTLAAPIDQRLQRLSTLQDTIYQKTPQADSLIAPELLTVMAGGQGSGLRMNEAEIARIVGGRSNWESLQAAVNKWKGPGNALSITDPQRAQIQSLIGTVNDRLVQKRAALDDAYENLNNASDPAEHRRIVNEARRAMTAADSGQGSKAPAPAAPVFSKYSASGDYGWDGAKWVKVK